MIPLDRSGPRSAPSSPKILKPWLLFRLIPQTSRTSPWHVAHAVHIQSDDKRRTYRLRIILFRKVVEKAARIALKVALGVFMAWVLFDQVLPSLPVDGDSLWWLATTNKTIGIRRCAEQILGSRLRMFSDW